MKRYTLGFVSNQNLIIKKEIPVENYRKQNREQKQLPRGVLQASASNFIEKETLAQVFFREFCDIAKNTYSYRTPPVAASGEKKHFPRTISNFTVEGLPHVLNVINNKNYTVT